MRSAAIVYAVAFVAALVVICSAPASVLACVAVAVYIAAHLNMSYAVRTVRPAMLTAGMRRAALRGTAGARHHAAHWHGGHN